MLLLIKLLLNKIPLHIEMSWKNSNCTFLNLKLNFDQVCVTKRKGIFKKFDYVIYILKYTMCYIQCSNRFRTNFKEDQLI